MDVSPVDFCKSGGVDHRYLRLQTCVEQDAEIANEPYPKISCGDGKTFEFKFLGRTCFGTRLHEAILRDDIHRIAEVLEREPELLKERFTYVTYFKGNSQEGSGEAIHLAASRGHLEVLKFLVEKGASLEAMVTRNDRNHYDVLHAGVFAEGRGGSKDVIKYLLDAKAPMTANIDGHYPLHKAFQTGNKVGIALLREERHKRNLPDIEERTTPGSIATPLEFGINGGKMSEDALASVAPLTPMALHVFSGCFEGCIAHEPRCIPKWLERCRNRWPAHNLAKNVSVAELSKVLEEAPESGDALFRAITSTPRVIDEGWNPLPARVSFAPRTFFQKIYAPLNPRRTLLSFYEPESTWDYDPAHYKKPAWQSVLPTPGSADFRRPIRDVNFIVCNLSDIAGPELFLAIASAANWKNDESEALVIFENPIVRGLISFVWWQATCRIELLTLFYEFWGLALLIFDQYISAMSYWVSEDEANQRLLRGHGGGSQTDYKVNHDGQVLMQQDLKHCVDHVMVSFIGAWGMVIMLSEALSLGGFYLVGRPRSYFTANKLVPLLQGLLPIMLIVYPDCVWIGMSVVIYYWANLLKLCYFSENLAHVFLPITDLAYGLGPSLVLTVIAACAFLHALFKLKENQGIPPAVIIHESFTTLFTSELTSPDFEHPELMLRQNLFAYVCVLIFSLFFLNIFIGVISEAYAEAKENVVKRYQQDLAEVCTRYLLRCKCLRGLGFGMKLPDITAGIIILICFFCIAGAQAYAFKYNLVFENLGKIFSVFMGLSTLAAYHHPKCPWKAALDGYKKEKGDNFYLWVVYPQTAGDEMDAEYNAAIETMEHLKAKNHEIQRMMVSQASQLFEDGDDCITFNEESD